MVSKFSNVLIILSCYFIVYLSLLKIINYYNPSGLIYLNMYSIYYICFIVTLLFAVLVNYYIYDKNALVERGFIEEVVDAVTDVLTPTPNVVSAADVLTPTPNVVSAADVLTPTGDSFTK